MNRTTSSFPLDRLFWPAVIVLGAAVALFQFTNFDVSLQDHFYDFAAGRWLVDEQEPVGRALFYNGPKYAIMVLGLALVVLAVGPARWYQALRFERRGLWLAVATLALLPALTAIGKVVTNVVCPKDIRRYGGAAPYVKLCSPYPEHDRPVAGGRCFPAAHAAGGFALIGLAWLRSSRRWQTGAVLLGTGAGWIMGGYQILKGAHYLSDTIATMALAWIVALALRRLLRVKSSEEETVLPSEASSTPMAGWIPPMKRRRNSLPTSR